MRIRYIALIATLAASLLSAPTASACNMNPTAVISAPAASSSHIHGTGVSFVGTSSTASCGWISAYIWRNGVTVLSYSSSFSYNVTLEPEQVDSVITVSLQVINSYGRSHTVNRTITIKRDHQSQYFVKDHLGSPRVVVDGKGAVLSYTDYYPFGMVMPDRADNYSLSNDRVKFTGYLLEEEGGQDTYHAEARGYDPVIGRFTSRDPLYSLYPSYTPYAYALNNPLSYIDPTGLFSTHTDSSGAVIAVYDDGDHGIYQHSDATSREQVDTKRASTQSTSGGGTMMGETEIWDEFAEKVGINQTPILIDQSTNAYRPLEARILFGKRWDPVLLSMNRSAQLLDPINLAFESAGGGYFDLKTSAEYGTQGRLLGGYYTSSRSAGNFLAGMNARTAGFSFETFQRTAGGLHRAGKSGAARAFFGKEYGSPPMYGEIEIQYRWSLRGYHGQLRW